MNKKIILGIDEVGRGPWAGPLVIGAVVLGAEAQDFWAELNDSKKLTSRKREYLNQLILNSSLAASTGWVTVAEIDTLGLSASLKLATRRAVKPILAQKVRFDEIIIDGTQNFLKDTPLESFVTTLKKADMLIKEVSAASIIAKVARDQYMANLDAVYPGYDFAAHVGYGTAKHSAALQKLGVCPEHRRSFRPIQKILAESASPAQNRDEDEQNCCQNYNTDPENLDKNSPKNCCKIYNIDSEILDEKIAKECCKNHNISQNNRGNNNEVACCKNYNNSSEKSTKISTKKRCKIYNISQEKLDDKSSENCCQNYNSLPERVDNTAKSGHKNDKSSKTDGTIAETAVVKFLKNQNHQLVARNLRTRFYEIDIITTKNQKIYFTEVKYSHYASTEGTALARIDKQKQQRMQFAAEAFCQNHPDYANYQPVLAVAEVSGRDFTVERWFELNF